MEPTHDAPAQTSNQQAHAESQTPTPMSPPRSKTPPTITGKRPHSETHTASGNDGAHRAGSEPVNPIALNKALKEVERSGQRRVSTPTASPSRKRQKVQAGDRFIPNRAGQDLSASYNLLHDEGSPATPSKLNKKAPGDLHLQKREANRTYSSLLRSEMFDNEVPQIINERSGSRAQTPPVIGNTNATSLLSGSALTPSTPHKNLFSYGPSAPVSLTPRSISRSERGPNINARSEIYSLSPVKHSSQSMLLSPRKTPRSVSKVPYKVLDAPDLADDFYLNLVDWGSNDILAVGLGPAVYLWNRDTGKVTTLCNLENDTVTSVSWIQRGTHLAIGTSKGLLHIWDTDKQKRLRTMTGHSSRISSLAWNSHILSTGSRDRNILHRDVRSPVMHIRRLTGHKQEVCGLKWNSDTEQLASGGNDNKIFIWDRMDERWQHRWGEQEGGHRAAVKAIAWNPHQRGVLASGGGTADRCIKFWNTISNAQTSSSRSIPIEQTNLGLGLTTSPLPETTLSPQMLNPHLISSHDTGSQVCNLLFSQRTSELVSTHGYSQHAINIWKYPSMNQVVSLTGHTYRVLYLSMSPDGAIIVTGAGDETLRFWDVFNKPNKEAKRGIVGEWGVIR
ncbi:related to anaphase promoting complex, Cdc20, Cdh1, and Ama1 subunits [Lecanosticta acicola]|uniref:Related to anaphase promoting complex, Cdc20, Cdh1, and Ama1 subunits n=1 Tax=Lecanosticta acicola TaxID=111012 RepID=A0AAI8Z3B6_9PEZI|nr:related to anaphase promoting complex, Cdc20, Cdh1, and Ama1 subunits [Lecanosticta acicola]